MSARDEVCGLTNNWGIGRGSTVDHLVGHYHRLKSDASYCREPVNVMEKGVHMRELLVEHEVCLCAFWTC